MTAVSDLNRYQRLKALGQCVTCTRRPAMPGRVRCRPCAVEASKRSSEMWRRKQEAEMALTGVDGDAR